MRRAPARAPGAARESPAGGPAAPAGSQVHGCATSHAPCVMRSRVRRARRRQGWGGASINHERSSAVFRMQPSSGTATSDGRIGGRGGGRAAGARLHPHVQIDQHVHAERVHFVRSLFKRRERHIVQPRGARGAREAAPEAGAVRAREGEVVRLDARVQRRHPWRRAHASLVHSLNREIAARQLSRGRSGGRHCCAGRGGARRGGVGRGADR